MIRPEPEDPAALAPGRLVQADCLTFMATLPAASIDLIYVDPPFFTGREQTGRERAPGNSGATGTASFNDRWDEGLPGYLAWIDARLTAMRPLLTPTGSIYVHLDWHAVHYVKVAMDRVYGYPNFLNEIVWLYGLGGSSPRFWPRKHDTLLWYAREAGQHYFVAPRIPATSQRMKGQTKKVPDYWEIPSLNNMAKERLGYPTQKPEALLERIVRSSCPEGGVVADFFCGSGTTLAVAERTGRAWIGCDESADAVRLARERLGKLTTRAGE